MPQKFRAVIHDIRYQSYHKTSGGITNCINVCIICDICQNHTHCTQSEIISATPTTGALRDLLSSVHRWFTKLYWYPEYDSACVNGSCGDSGSNDYSSSNYCSNVVFLLSSLLLLSSELLLFLLSLSLPWLFAIIVIIISISTICLFSIFQFSNKMIRYDSLTKGSIRTKIEINNQTGTVQALRWRHNGSDCVSNHQPHDCLLNRLFRHRSKKT